MTITAKIITDSISPHNKRLTSIQLRYPRFIHAEFMTHRMFSRNSSSSRAIPIERLIKDVEEDTARPIHWGKNQSGMQAREELDEQTRLQAIAMWGRARNDAIENARNMHMLGAHKQIVNRVLEPYAHINTIVTATEWDNFFELRRHPDAQPEIKELADCMWTAMQESEPQKLDFNEWHLPYVLPEEKQVMNNEICIKLSVARCARVSYMTHEGKPPNTEEDLKLYDRLVGSKPLHASPAEHQAKPADKSYYEHDNFTGWVSCRVILEGRY